MLNKIEVSQLSQATTNCHWHEIVDLNVRYEIELVPLRSWGDHLRRKRCNREVVRRLRRSPASRDDTPAEHNEVVLEDHSRLAKSASDLLLWIFWIVFRRLFPHIGG